MDLFLLGGEVIPEVRKPLFLLREASLSQHGC